MTMCGALVYERDYNRLKNLGVKDSKKLTPKQREFLFNKITEIIHNYKILIIQPREIDNALNSDELNLNRLEAIKSALIINNLKPDKVILDCPSTNITDYVDYLKLFLKNKKVEIIAEYKAERYIPVAAASILAKVTRDMQIKKIQMHIKDNIGSGYASDPYTIKFLKENYDKYPEIFRKSWSTYKKIANQKKLNEF